MLLPLFQLSGIFAACLSPCQLTQHETLFAGPWGPAQRPCGVNLGLSVFFCLPQLASLCLFVSVFVSVAGPLRFLVAGNGRCCVPRRQTWRQCPALPTPNPRSPLLTVLGSEVPGWTGEPHCTDSQEAGLRWRRAWPGSDHLFGMAPCCLPSNGPTGRTGLGSGKHGLGFCDTFPVCRCVVSTPRSL